MDLKCSKCGTNWPIGKKYIHCHHIIPKVFRDEYNKKDCEMIDLCFRCHLKEDGIHERLKNSDEIKNNIRKITQEWLNED